MKSLQNFLNFINNNLTSILVCIGLIIGIYNRVKAWLAKSDEEKIDFAIGAVRETMLKFVTKAEGDYADWNKAGSIKRAEVIDAIYKRYPILAKAVDQEALIKKIDEAIDAALPELEAIIKSMKYQEKIEASEV